jgi:hypothetical protein
MIMLSTTIYTYTLYTLTHDHAFDQSLQSNRNAKTKEVATDSKEFVAMASAAERELKKLYARRSISLSCKEAAKLLLELIGSAEAARVLEGSPPQLFVPLKHRAVLERQEGLKTALQQQDSDKIRALVNLRCVN